MIQNGDVFWFQTKHAWNAFTGNIQMNYRDLGMSYPYRADRPRMSRGNERSIVTSVYNRIALDVAALNVQHVRLDENGRFLSVIDDGLNNCLTLEANVDQTARSFIQDVVISMFDEGSVAIVPVDTTTDPNVSGSYDIQSLRVGQILDWYPQYIRTRVYNEQTGRKEDIVVPKVQWLSLRIRCTQLSMNRTQLCSGSFVNLTYLMSLMNKADLESLI